MSGAGRARPGYFGVEGCLDSRGDLFGLVSGLDAAAASSADALRPATRTMVNISLDILVFSCG